MPLLLICTLQACRNEPDTTTHTSSSTFQSLTEKQTFLEKYVTFRRQYIDLNYRIDFYDNGSGRQVPGPSDFELGIFALVPTTQIEEWIKNLERASAPQDLKWIEHIPHTEGLKPESFIWYKKNAKEVGILDNKVLYHIWSR